MKQNKNNVRKEEPWENLTMTNELMEKINVEDNEGEEPVINSRYSIVMATAKRARQIVAGEAYVSAKDAAKPLSTAVKELADGSITILPEMEEEEPDEKLVLSDEE